MESQEARASNGKAILTIGLWPLIAVQIAMLLVLNVFDYAYIFPSQSGLTMGHAYLFLGVYVVALTWGLIHAFRRSHWVIGTAQIMAPILLCLWLMRPPQNYDSAKYQFLVGKTRAEVDAILGWKSKNGFGRDSTRVYDHYYGMQIYYAVDPDNRRGEADQDDLVIAVEPSP
jgi:hypothetical protein